MTQLTSYEERLRKGLVKCPNYYKHFSPSEKLKKK